eukprot:scaffold3526_cov115-Cylindrotheca_fusiformis.AAC.13
MVDDFFAGGLEDLCKMTKLDVADTAASYAKRSDGEFPIIFSPSAKKRLLSLVLWIRIAVENVKQFPDGMTAAQFQMVIDDSLLRDERWDARKKIGETYLDATFTTKLKGQAQWEKLELELKSMIVPYEEGVVDATKPSGPNFKTDAHPVHQLLFLKNVSEDLDAYTYIKAFMEYTNGWKDVKALRNRYANQATKQTLINSANKAMLETLRYKLERSFSFEKFSGKLQQKAYDDLETNGRKVHNRDVVDGLWSITTKGCIFEEWWRAGECPATGAHTVDGTLYIGICHSVQPHHREILQARSQEDGGKNESCWQEAGLQKRSSRTRRSCRRFRRRSRLLRSLSKILMKMVMTRTRTSDSDKNAGDLSEASISEHVLVI